MCVLAVSDCRGAAQQRDPFDYSTCQRQNRMIEFHQGFSSLLLKAEIICFRYYWRTSWHCAPRVWRGTRRDPNGDDCVRSWWWYLEEFDQLVRLAYSPVYEMDAKQNRTVFCGRSSFFSFETSEVQLVRCPFHQLLEFRRIYIALARGIIIFPLVL